jgi:hypothetical protein
MSAPGKIIMIRHGQSAANADTSIYNRVPDYRIPLTLAGLEHTFIDFRPFHSKSPIEIVGS